MGGPVAAGAPGKWAPRRPAAVARKVPGTGRDRPSRLPLRVHRRLDRLVPLRVVACTIAGSGCYNNEQYESALGPRRATHPVAIPAAPAPTNREGGRNGSMSSLRVSPSRLSGQPPTNVLLLLRSNVAPGRERPKSGPGRPAPRWRVCAPVKTLTRPLLLHDDGLAESRSIGSICYNNYQVPSHGCPSGSPAPT